MLIRMRKLLVYSIKKDIAASLDFLSLFFPHFKIEGSHIEMGILINLS